MAAMHASSCPHLYPAYSPVLTYFPAPNGLVSQESLTTGSCNHLQLVTTGSYLHDLTRVIVEVHWEKGLQ